MEVAAGPTSEELAQLKATLESAVQAMSARQLQSSARQLAKAEKLARLPIHLGPVTRLQVLQGYLEQFWEGVQIGMTRIEAGRELRIGSQIGGVVEVTPQRLVVRIAGRNRRFDRDDLPPEVTVAVAQLWFDSEEAATKMVLGAFWAVDPQGDPRRAKRLWLEAQRQGVDVGDLLAFLEDDHRNRDGEAAFVPLP
jgi:hypothetical protein